MGKPNGSGKDKNKGRGRESVRQKEGTTEADGRNEEEYIYKTRGERGMRKIKMKKINEIVKKGKLA